MSLGSCRARTNITAHRGTFRQLSAGELTASSTISDETLTKKLCVGTVCVTEAQLSALLSQSAAASPTISPPTEIRDASAKQNA